MRILKIIFSRGQASGGHYHSCDQISSSLSEGMSVKIVSIGSKRSKVLMRNPCFAEHLEYTSLKNLQKLNTHFKRIRDHFQPDIIHCYDTESLNIILILPSLWKFKVVLTKCGGPNPKRRKWQFANAIICFSYENYLWFTSNKAYGRVKLHLIANRVYSVNISKDLNQKDSPRKDKKTFTFMRISRLGGAYEMTLLATFNLIEKLKNDFEIKLLVVGRIQNQDRFDYFKNYAKLRNLPVEFITDERAFKASDLLYLADCVIGTGRSLMEATSIGLPVLTPALNSDIPIFLDKNNFENFFRTNFSERNVAENRDIDSNFDSIIKLICDRNFYDETRREIKILFRKNFSTSNNVERYIKVYKNLKKSKIAKRTNLVFKNTFYIVHALLNRH